MGLQDLFITPIYILLLSFLAYMVRPFVTTPETRKYFLPALWVRFFGAIMLGVLYQFYYDGGDTFNYFTHGSKWIWEAFLDDPFLGVKMLVDSGGAERAVETFQYNQNIWYYRDTNSFFVVRITAFFDLFTFHTYTATALLFASFSFSGLWAFYYAVQNKYPHNKNWLAIGILFVPSVVFWGSGILKDTITLGSLGWLTWALISLINLKKRKWYYFFWVAISVWLLMSVKAYIAICYAPCVFLWIYWQRIINVRNGFIKAAVAPILLLFFVAMGYIVMDQIGKSNKKYSLDTIAERAAITAYDIRFGWGARTGGEGGYNLGDLDGTWQSMIRLMPAAINVSLFRPYLWEVRNPLMLLSSAESLIILVLTIWMVIKGGFRNIHKDAFLVFCLIFTLLFAFAVGVSTFNFGTLMRYKIPMLPFFMIVTFTVNLPSLQRKN